MKEFNLNLISKYRSVLMGISILWIWFLHMSFKFPFPVSAVQNIGALGVDIFFFVSAIGIYYSYSKNSNTVEFYKKRVLRIIPTYLIFAIPYRIYEFFINKNGEGVLNLIKYTVKEVLNIGFWTHGSASLWYIPSILVFYLLYPLLYRIFVPEKNLSKRVIWLCVLSLLAIAVNYSLVVFDVPRPTDRWLLRIPVFLLGCFIAPYIKNGHKIKINGWIWAAAFAAVWAVYTFLNIKTGLLYWHDVMWGMLFCTLMAVPLIFVFPSIFEKLKLPRLQKILSWLGKYTLEIYILNEITLGIARNVSENSLVIDFISIAVTGVIIAVEVLIKKLAKNKKQPA